MCHSKQIEFIHIPKTGGSAVVYAAMRGLQAVWATPLWKMCGMEDDWLTNVSLSQASITLNHNRNGTRLALPLSTQHFQKLGPLQLNPIEDRLWHIPPRFIVNSRPHTDTFCIIREPFARLLSQYRFGMRYYIPDSSLTESNLTVSGHAKGRWRFTWRGGFRWPWEARVNCPLHGHDLCHKDNMNCVVQQWLKAFQHNPAVLYWHLAPQAWFINTADSPPQRTCKHVLVHGPNLSRDFNALMADHGLKIKLPPTPNPRKTQRPSSWRELPSSWREMFIGPVVDRVYDKIGADRTNIMHKTVCPLLAVQDFNEVTKELVRRLWIEDFHMWKEIQQERNLLYSKITPS